MWSLSRFLLAIALLEISLCYAISLFLWWPWPLVLILACIVRSVRGGVQLWQHGRAKWANCGDLLNANMVGVERGLSIGRLIQTDHLKWLPSVAAIFNGRLSSKDACVRVMARLRVLQNKVIGEEVRLTKTPHTVIISPTGLGKTSSLVIDQLRESDEPTEVLDYKGEISKLTAETRRKKFGHRIVRLDPYEVVTKHPDSYNPLDFINRDSPHAIDDCRFLAEQLVVREPEEREKHFSDAAEMWITAAILATVLFAPSHRRSLQHVREILSDANKLPQLIESLELAGGINARLGNQLKHFKERELASVLTTANRHLRFLDSPAIVESTSSSSFDPRNLRRGGKMTIYCTIPPKFVHTAAPLLRLWIGCHMMAVMDHGLNDNVVKFVLDEAASLKDMRCIDEAVQKGRAFGINLQLFYQSTAQLKICFPLGQDENLLANVTQVYFGVNNSTAEQLSSKLGDHTIVVNSGGTSSGYSRTSSQAGMNDSVSYSDNTSHSWQLVGRKLMKPEEILTMSERIALTFVPGLPPIRTVLQRYYEKDPRKPSLSLKRQVLNEAICFLIIASFCLFFTLKLEEHARHVRTNRQIHSKVLPRNR